MLEEQKANELKKDQEKAYALSKALVDHTFSMGVKKDIDGANDVDDLSKQLEHTTISDKGSDFGESSATTESIPATLK